MNGTYKLNYISLIKINIFIKYKIYITYYIYIFIKHKIFYSSENISLNFESNIYK